jgi:exodeoxyribonuclease VII small subunit
MKKKRTLEELLKAENYQELAAELTFEDGMNLLEELVATVEAGTLPLEQAVESYERGVALVSQLRAKLEGAEERLKLLQKDGTVTQIESGHVEK